MEAVGLPVLVGAVAFTLYVSTLARTITWEHGGGDGPELAAAAYVLGVAHPPGYPLYLLLAHLFAQIPIGEIAFRVGLLAAAAAALGVGLAAHLVWTLSPIVGPARIVAALAAGASLATSPIYWSKATIVDVHPLNAACVLAGLTIVAHWEPSADRIVVALALLLGLGLGNHLTLALMALPLALMVLIRDPRLLLRRGGLAAAGALGLGLLVYAYLPIRAWAQPALNWGNPGDPSAFLDHVSFRLYHGYFAQVAVSDVLARLPVTARLMAEQLTWPGLVLAFIGLGQLWARRRDLAIAFLSGSALIFTFSILYNAQYPETFFLPIVPVLALGLGLGIAEVAAVWRVPLATSAAVLIVGWQLWTQWPAMDVSRDESAATYARTTLAEAAPDSIIWTSDDFHTFALWYMQVVEGRGPDVAVVDRRLLSSAWYVAALERQHPGIRAQLPSRSAPTSS